MKLSFRNNAGLGFLIALAVLALHGMGVASNEHYLFDDGWRRTATGWQNMADWYAQPPVYAPPIAATKIHPLVVASGETLASITVLLVFLRRVKR